jgi:hypothetical protein
LEEDIAKKRSENKEKKISAKDLAISELSKASRIQPPKKKQNSSHSKEDASFHSLLPPPTKDPESGLLKDTNGDVGLSSWDDFLGVGKGKTSPLPSKKIQNSRSLSSKLRRKKQKNASQSSKRNKKLGNNTSKEELPSIADLFPPDLYNNNNNKAYKGPQPSKQNKNKRTNKSNNKSVSPPPLSLDGVLPVSDLFYRSSQSMNDEEEPGVDGDDDELPFSAEQSDQLTTVHNKIKIRRNQASRKPSQNNSRKPRRKFSKPRKMVRRGMEMLVGGVPINADPPQRYIDLVFQSNASWQEAILINSRDFGPLYHSNSVHKISQTQQALFCEHFVSSALKWVVCPQELKTIVETYTSGLLRNNEESKASIEESPSLQELVDDDLLLLERSDLQEDEDESSIENDDTNNKDDDDEKNKAKSSEGSGFGTLTSFNSESDDNDSFDKSHHLGGELVFSIGVSSDELESTPSVLERVLARGIAAATECTGFEVSFDKLILTDMDDGTTMISGQFTLTLMDESMSHADMGKKAQRINSSLAQAMDDGDMQLAMASAAKEETGWPESVRDRVVEEFLFDDDDGDGPLDEDDEEDEIPTSKKKTTRTNEKQQQSTGVSSLDMTKDVIDEYDGPFGMPGSKIYHKDDLFLGRGNDGVFWDYSGLNLAQAPYQGNLGLRLVDATVQRAKERYPRVIAIGDVHGCIDELQDLLRKCDYRPGDLIVFLGDLVSKGPDSISVVQMARELGAIGVRGNHDFEVVRWHQAIKSGVDPPVVGSEHFHIASCLSKADMKWMYSLPWYISSKELGALFVHAGFVSGIRLAKQNPRLMMNMRSILPDGTVTSKFFNNWPWARLWDGPQTVLFGHDADRGLQQYEHAIGLDTGCVYGGRLTACILPEKRLVSVSARREYFKYRRKHYD